MYSQQDEEKTILEYFGSQRGAFLDIGAYDGVTFSNTLALAERGWNGILYEASPRCFCKLVDNYVNRNLNAFIFACMCVGVENKTSVQFWDSIEAVGTSNKDNYEKWKDLCRFKLIMMPQVAIQDILAEGHCFNFANVDIEGSSVPVAKYIVEDAARSGLQLICIEVDDKYEEFDSWMSEHGFALLNTFSLGANRIYRRK